MHTGGVGALGEGALERGVGGGTGRLQREGDDYAATVPRAAPGSTGKGGVRGWMRTVPSAEEGYLALRDADIWVDRAGGPRLATWIGAIDGRTVLREHPRPHPLQVATPWQ